MLVSDLLSKARMLHKPSWSSARENAPVCWAASKASQSLHPKEFSSSKEVMEMKNVQYKGFIHIGTPQSSWNIISQENYSTSCITTSDWAMRLHMRRSRVFFTFKAPAHRKARSTHQGAPHMCPGGVCVWRMAQSRQLLPLLPGS